jgi:hypothetical protein
MNSDIDLAFQDKEIDIRELFLTTWREKVFIVGCMLAAIAIASFNLHRDDRKYTVTYTFQPASGISGEESLSHLDLLSEALLSRKGNSGFETLEILLKSVDVSKNLILNQSIVRQLFSNEWNEEAQRFEMPEQSFGKKIKYALKAKLIGHVKGEYTPPNAARLSAVLLDAFDVSKDINTGLLTLSSETSTPKLTLELMSASMKVADQIIKDKFLLKSRLAIDSYKQLLAQTRSRKNRQRLALLMLNEQHKQMIASSSDFFVAKPLTSPFISLYPTSPNDSIVLILYAVLGFFFGALATLIRKVFKYYQL